MPIAIVENVKQGINSSCLSGNNRPVFHFQEFTVQKKTQISIAKYNCYDEEKKVKTTEHRRILTQGLQAKLFTGTRQPNWAQMLTITKGIKIDSLGGKFLPGKMGPLYEVVHLFHSERQNSWN